MNSFLQGLFRINFGNIIHRAGSMLVWILIIGGIYALRFDAREMALKKLEREERLTRFLGWLQIAAGFALLLIKELLIYLM